MTSKITQVYNIRETPISCHDSAIGGTNQFTAFHVKKPYVYIRFLKNTGLSDMIHATIWTDRGFKEGVNLREKETRFLIQTEKASEGVTLTIRKEYITQSDFVIYCYESDEICHY